MKGFVEAVKFCERNGMEVSTNGRSGKNYSVMKGGDLLFSSDSERDIGCWVNGYAIGLMGGE